MKPRTLGLMLIVIALIAGVVAQLRAGTNKSNDSFGAPHLDVRT